MHFEIKEFTTDKPTGFTKVTISYCLGKVTDTDSRAFVTPETATNYCNSMRRDWLKLMMEKYVKHAKKIFESTRNIGYYNDADRLNSLTRCINAMNIVAQENDIKVVASYISSAEKLLKHILPHTENNSYSSSLERLNAMQQVARQFMQANKPNLVCSN